MDVGRTRFYNSQSAITTQCLECRPDLTLHCTSADPNKTKGLFLESGRGLLFLNASARGLLTTMGLHDVCSWFPWVWFFFFWCPLYALTFEADRLFILPPESPPLVYSKYDVEIWLFSRSDRLVSTCIILWQNGGCKSINSNLPILIQPRQKIENSFAGFCKVTDVHVLMMYSKRL